MSVLAQAHPQNFSLYLRQMNKHSSNYFHYECKSLMSKDKEIFQKKMNVCLKAFSVKSAKFHPETITHLKVISILAKMDKGFLRVLSTGFYWKI